MLRVVFPKRSMIHGRLARRPAGRQQDSGHAAELINAPVQQRQVTRPLTVDAKLALGMEHRVEHRQVS
jgi:hypothetical protein